jgi:peptidyl-prolyl cis-trans isomerase C
MNAATTGGGCGSGACQCAGGSGDQGKDVPAAIDGIALHAPGERPDPATLSERAWGELLRQEAVRQGLLPPLPVLDAPVLTAQDQQAIQSMLDEQVPLKMPSEDECSRYYEAHRSRFAEGRQVHVRHILFAVTDGLDVHALAVRAEKALLELARRGVPPERFAQLARELSNCPSAAQGGDLGWLAPGDCAEELANEFFEQKDSLHGMGVHPRLVHSRFGLHIVEVLARKHGRQLGYEQVRERIAMDLAQRSRATALHQYIRLLAGKALVEGIDLEGATSPLVQ